MAEQGLHRGDLARVFGEGVIVRDGLWFRVDQEFVGITATRLAVERGTPLAEDLLQLLLPVCGELFDVFDAECAQRAFGDFADAGNFADGKWGKKACFHSGSDPKQAARLGLIRSDLRDQTSAGEPARARKGG